MKITTSNLTCGIRAALIISAAAAELVLAGCSVTKVNYEKNEKGEVSYRLYRNSHWLKMEGEGMRGGMTQDGKFEFDLEGMKTSPSEEFNRTMQTYTTAFVQLAQIAAAAYNPSASSAINTAAKATPSTQAAIATPAHASTNTTVAVNICTGEPLSGGSCTDGSCTNAAACTDGACAVK